MKADSSEILSSVQILRGVAAAMVVAYHLPFYIGFTDSLAILRSGVDLFFVISGFVMMVSTLNRRGDVYGFVWKRLVRVVPLYWLATIVFGIVWIVAGVRELHLDQLVMSLLFVPYLDETSGLVQPVLGVGWTLNLEICFYALFALSMFLRPWMQVVVLTTVFLVLVAVRVVVDPSEQSVLFFYTTPILLEFAGGMAIGLVLPALRSMPKALGLVLLAAGAVAMVVLDQPLSLPRTLALGIPSLAIVAAAVIAEPYFKAHVLSPLRLLGDASYALYLTHLIVMVSLQALLAGWQWWAAGPTMFALCLLVSVFTFRFVERPVLSWARTLNTSRRAAVV